jgi:protein-arginine kinase activator protein McsA
MNARGRALSLVEKGQKEEAVQTVEEGCRRIEQFLADYNRTPENTECRELDMLKRLQVEIASEVVMTKPKSPRSILEERLREAVSREDYEQAAYFRDRLRKMPLVEDEGLGDPSI